MADADKLKEKLGLQTYDTAGDYDLPPMMPEEHKGYGSGKCGTYEIRIGACKDPINPLLRPISFNPVVTMIGLATLVAFLSYCIDEGIDAKNNLSEWQTWVTVTFTWLYIGSQDAWIVFLIAVYFKYGNVKLGKDTDVPEFTSTTYFAMIFSCGVAVGLFVYGTAEPLYHYGYWYKHSLNSNGETDAEMANMGILTTIFHWGFHGWVVYSLVAIQLGIMSFRYNLPLCIRSCFYPLLGRHTWGWIGDLIDGFSIVTIIAGVCTSLGLGAIQIRRGFEGMNAWDVDDCDSDCQDGHLLWIIWSITGIATISVVSGLHIGIKILSTLAFYLGVFILMVTIFYGDTWFFLNVMTEQCGLYLHYAFTVMGFRTDAFTQLPEGGGRPIDQAVPDGFMNGWTIFYWGWWIAWSPFVGSFVARISRGRTIREVLNFTLTMPLLFSLVWFSVFGGAAIQMEWKAHRLQQAGVALYGDPTYFQVGQHGNGELQFGSSYAGPVHFDISAWGTASECSPYTGSATCAEYVEAEDTSQGCATPAVVCSEAKGWEAQQANVGCNTPAGSISDSPAAGGCAACFVQVQDFGNGTHGPCDVWKDFGTGRDVDDCPPWIANWNGDTRFQNQCLFSDWDQEASWYNVVGQFGDIAEFMQGISIFTLVLYFVTSSDSGSLIVDTLAANGRDEQNPLQRVAWAIIEGLVATGLVLGGSGDEEASAKDVLKALQAASICAGLPFTILLCLMMPAMWYGLEQEGETEPAKAFAVPIYGGVFDVIDVVLSLGKAPMPSMKTVFDTIISIPLPFVSLFRVLQLMADTDEAPPVFGSVVFGTIWYTTMCLVSGLLFIVFQFVQLDDSSQGYWAIGWVFYTVFAMTIANVRYRLRLFRDIRGNIFEDFFASLFMYPCVLMQMLQEAAAAPASSVKSKVGAEAVEASL